MLLLLLAITIFYIKSSKFHAIGALLVFKSSVLSVIQLLTAPTIIEYFLKLLAQ